MKYTFLTLLCVFCFSQLPAQIDKIFPEKELQLLESYEDTMGLMSHLIINDSLEENRFAATKKMIQTLVTALKIDNSFHYPFQQIKSVSVQYPQDSTFRIFTWQLYVNKDEYRYYGAIQMNKKELELFPLIDRSNQVKDLEHQQLAHNEWYGALYYNLKEFDTPEGKKYLLFGFDGYSFFEKRKVIEVLSFKEGKPLFGEPLLLASAGEDSDETRPVSRFILTYSAEASILCNFDESEDKVVYNHLMISGNPYTGEPTYIPSGSYDGFELQDGKWVYQKELFHFITPVNEYPRPEPVLGKPKEGKRKNLFGQK